MGEDQDRVIARPGEDNVSIRFGRHAPEPDSYYNTPEMHSDLRVEFRKFARHLEIILPIGDARALALEKLQESSMWAHQAIDELDPVVNE
jgi:hypothetical protein